LDTAKALDDVVQQLRAQQLALQEVRHRFGASVERLQARIEIGEMTLSTSMAELAHALERFSNEVEESANKHKILERFSSGCSGRRCRSARGTYRVGPASRAGPATPA
jgi:hypothetical protein